MKQILSLAAVLFLAGCATEYVPTKTGLQLQSFQKREFPTSKRIAFSSVVTVFQDLGYIIGSADLETGFITAKNPAKSREGMFTTTTRDTRGTAFLEEINPKATSIRISFVKLKSVSGTGSSGVDETPIEDPAFYAGIFEKIEQAIFIRTSTQ